MNEDLQPYLERIALVTLACGDLTPKKKLDLLSAAWLLVASEARNTALVEPGGFPAERERQLELLGRLVDLTEAAEPDLEAERIAYEGDYDGIQQRVLDALCDEREGDAG